MTPQDGTLSIIAESLIRQNLIPIAIEVANTITDPIRKSHVVLTICMALIKERKITQAMKLIDKQITEVQALKEDESSLHHMRVPRAARGGAGCSGGELKVSFVRDEFFRVLSQIFTPLIESGYYTEAFTLAAKMPDYYSWEYTLKPILRRMSFEEAINVANRIPHDYMRSWALHDISIVLHEVSALSGVDVAKFANQLLVVATRESDILIRSRALVLLKRFDEAVAMAESTSNIDHKNTMFDYISNGYAKKKNFEEAIKIANKISNSSLKTKLLANIEKAQTAAS